MKHRYDITVWDLTTGDVVESLRDATLEDLERIEDAYREEPGIDVVVDREWTTEDETEV